LAVNIVAVYLLKNENCYIVWVMIPQQLFQQRNAEGEAVISTFEFVD
jgi:hypothetical protein